LIVLIGAAFLVVDTRSKAEGVTVMPPTTIDRGSQVTVVPWEAVTTTTYVEPAMPPVPATAPPCRNSDIDVEIGAPTRYLQSPTARLLAFKNIGRAPCSLTGRPSVSATGSDGRTVTATPVDLMLQIAGPQYETDVLPVGTSSSAILWNRFDCAATPSATELDLSFGDRPIVVDAGLSRSETDAAQRDGYSFPDNPPVPTGCGLQIGAFTIAGVGQTFATPMNRLQYRLDTDSEARAGTTLALTLTLRNTTTRPIPLTPCPDYQANLQWTLPGQTIAQNVQIPGQLRCDLVSSVKPGTSVAFKLHLDVPVTAPPGSAYASVNVGSLFPPPMPRQVTILPK
jgi:hypothetical protein